LSPAGEAGRAATRDEDRELLRRYHERGDANARDALVERHLPLVRSLARRYAGRGEPIDDIEQVGAIGLIKAIDRFELEREVSLATYATPNVVGEIKRHFRDKGWAIRVPRALQELNAKMSATIDQLTSKLGRSPSVAEIAQALGSTPEEVLEALEVGAGGYLGDHAAVARVLGLGVDDVRERPAPVGLDDRGAGVVARGLYGQDHGMFIAPHRPGTLTAARGGRKRSQPSTSGPSAG